MAVSPSDQPTGMMSDNGAIVTVGIFCDGQPAAIVIPMGTDGTINKNKSMQDLCNAFQTNLFVDLQACLSSDAHITHVAAEAMVDGSVPYRIDYGPTDYPGTEPSGALPNQVAALAFFYEDARDVSPGAKIRQGRTFINGLSASDVVQDSISSGLAINIEALGTTLQHGFTDGGSPPLHWYRVLSTPRPRVIGITLKRIFEYGARGYVCTQKRRLFPR